MPRLCFLPPIASVGTKKGEKGEGRSPHFSSMAMRADALSGFLGGAARLGCLPPPRACASAAPSGGREEAPLNDHPSSPTIFTTGEKLCQST